MHRLTWTFVIAALLASAPLQHAGAQSAADTGMRDTTVRDTTMRVAGRVGAGMQVGQPGGVVAKWYRSPPVAYTALLTTDGDDYASLIVNRLWEGPLRNSPLGAFVGPGLLVGSTGLQRQGAFALGVNGLAGLNFYVEPFEVFLQVTSRFRFLPNREDDVGGTVGMRLYL